MFLTRGTKQNKRGNEASKPGLWGELPLPRLGDDWKWICLKGAFIALQIIVVYFYWIFKLALPLISGDWGEGMVPWNIPTPILFGLKKTTKYALFLYKKRGRGTWPPTPATSPSSLPILGMPPPPPLWMNMPLCGYCRFNMEVPWYIGLNPWLWIKGFRVRFPSVPGTFCPSARHFIHIAALHPGV